MTMELIGERLDAFQNNVPEQVLFVREVTVERGPPDTDSIG
ncbi:hypothetical protein [Nocardia alni]|nr:hypothetical protein [Nocardia alni]